MEKIKKNTSKTEETVTIPASEYAEFLSQKRALEKEYETLKGMYDDAIKRLDSLIAQITLSKKKQFGSSSEKSSTLQLSVFDEIEFFSTEEVVEEEPPTTTVKTHTRKKSKELPSRLPENIEIEVVECKIEEEVTCHCGHERHVIGKETVRKELAIIPAKVMVKEYVQYAYGCRNCEVNGTEVSVIKGPVPKAIIKGSFASAEAIAHIATEKFVMGTPLYRQEQDLKRKGIELSRQTMSNWLIRATEDYLTPIYEKLHEDLKKNHVIHADETTLQVLRELDKAAQSKSYMWLYRTGRECDYHIVLYEYQKDRKNKRPREFLVGFSGYLQTDGYNGYKKLPGEIVNVGCFAHARRKFVEALETLKHYPDGEKKKTIAFQGKAFCDKLFEIERQIKDLNYEEKRKEREKRSKPIIDEMEKWLKEKQASSRTKVGEALKYLTNQWEYLIRFLEDGRLEISNNRAERSIKPFVIGRKNFLFANTPRGARTSSILYSIIETAKENNLDPYRYLLYIFNQSSNMENYNVALLMPNDKKVQFFCSNKRDK